MTTMDITDAESEYLQFCMVLGTTMVMGLPVADIIVEKIDAAIRAGVHRSSLEKLSPERAKEIAQMMQQSLARGDTIDDIKGTIAKTIDKAQSLSRGKNAH